MDHPSFRWYCGVFFGEGVTLGVCCTNGLDFLFFFLILRLMMGWDRSCA